MKYDFLSDEISLYGDNLMSLQTVLKELDSQTKLLTVDSRELNLFHIFSEPDGNKIALLDHAALLRLDARKPIRIAVLENDLFPTGELSENSVNQFNGKPVVGFFLTYYGSILEVSVDAMFMLMHQLAMLPKYNQRNYFVRNAYIALQLSSCKRDLLFICRQNLVSGRLRICAVFEKEYVYLPQKAIMQVIEEINHMNFLTDKYGLILVKKWSFNQQQTRIWCEFENSNSSFEQGIMLEISDTRKHGWRAYEILRKRRAKNYLIGEWVALKHKITDMSKIIMKNYASKGEQIDLILSTKENHLLFSDLDLMVPINESIYRNRIELLILKEFDQLKLVQILGKKRMELMIEYILKSIDFSKHLTEADFISILMDIPDILEKIERQVPSALMDTVEEIAFKLPFQELVFPN